ncbi:hypothetical protein JBL43_11935 [Aureibaculum sp. A20]|uniref:Uncharacterized protein n=1 Tax=Aureibaculum flavum TaxID=2795986 RepID=A0ABS0WSM0_9FLAO|nr:hypothetical protein [Aureibaculum flavum]MBJ2174952.1 hypothetical protein [Aureibaculum flavum]
MRFNIFTQIDFMRLLFLCVLMILFANCKSKSNTIPSLKTLQKQTFELEKCATNTNCSIEITPNSNLLIEQDELQNTYIKLAPGNNTIVKYEFKRKELPNVADGNYSELIYFEIDENNKQLFLTNGALQNVKMIYGRFCYCKDGTSGYFKVTQGRLKLIKNNKELRIDLNFKVGKIPQLLTEIKETITFK